MRRAPRVRSRPRFLNRRRCCSSRRVSIKGRAGDEAVLCTANETYALRLAEATNTLVRRPLARCAPPSPQRPASHSHRRVAERHRSLQLLVPPTGVDDASPTKVQKREPIEKHTSDVTTIVGSLTNTFILQHIPPRLQRARELLMRSVYRGAEAEAEVERGHLLTWEALLQEVQASPEELRRGLETMGAVEIGGFWRVIDDACLAEVTQLVLGLCIENDWPSSAVPAEDCVAQLPDYCPHVIRHCIAFYSSAAADPPPAAGTWSLDATKVCAFVAKSMLESETEEGGEVKQFPEAEFLEEWNDSTPADMTPDATMLRVRHGTLALARCLPPTWPATARPTSFCFVGGVDVARKLRRAALACIGRRVRGQAPGRERRGERIRVQLPCVRSASGHRRAIHCTL